MVIVAQFCCDAQRGVARNGAWRSYGQRLIALEFQRKEERERVSGILVAKAMVEILFLARDHRTAALARRRAPRART
jgi:hypothetical protein